MFWCVVCLFFFFKQKTAYELRISDWSSDVCSSDLAYTAEGDPNTGVIIGDEAVMVIDTQATPVMAQDVIRRIREVTDKPIKYILLSHYHAVREIGRASCREIVCQYVYDRGVYV